MDQLRTALTWLQRHHFWVLSVLVPLIALGCWWSASGKLSKLYNTNQGTINTEFTNVKNLRNDPFHPNDDVNAKQTAETKKQAADVAKLWQQLYDRQRVEVLKWPVPPLSKEFGDYVEKLQFGADIPGHLARNYQNYVDGHFKELPKQIEARVLDASGSAGPGGEFSRSGSFGPEGLAPPAAGEDENDYVCEWLDQSVIRDELNFPQQPSSLRIWVTQEDLWVYHTLLRVVAKTNRAANATRRSNAAIRTIAELAVGQRAAKYSRTVNRLAVPPATPQASGPGPGGAGPESGAPGPGPGPAGAGPEMGGMETFRQTSPGQVLSEAEERPVLLSGRYLSADGKPIPFGGGGGGAEQPSPSPGAGAPLDLIQFGEEYKRLPVRMVLEMDHRWLSFLIAACASEPLQIEVQEVHINTSDAAGTGGPGGGMRGFEGGPGRGSSGGNLFPDETGLQQFPSHTEIVNVAIQGTIYIFNKPNTGISQPPGDQPAANTSAGQ